MPSCVDTWTDRSCARSTLHPQVGPMYHGTGIGSNCKKYEEHALSSWEGLVAAQGILCVSLFVEMHFSCLVSFFPSGKGIHFINVIHLAKVYTFSM